MSSIEKLLIRGVRSFDPKHEEVVAFYTPLTLIVGHNGSGKTTIIEALKYITTGDLPPNSKGGAFINDPKVAGEHEVKAQIKLKFRSVTGQEMVATRSLQLTQKKNSVTQKTLESALVSKDPVTNETISTSNRCMDLDVDIPNHLGVSRAVLENVIFVHQEESNWPLSEPSVLKKKFDEIFAATKYTKALQSIKDLRKEQAVELKLETQKLEFLKQDKERSDRVKKDAESVNKKIEVMQGRVNELDNGEIATTMEQLRSTSDMLANIGGLEMRVQMKGVERENIEKQIGEIEARIEVLNHSDEELQRKLDRIKDVFNNLDAVKADIEDRRRKAEARQTELQADVNNLLTKKGQLQARSDENARKEKDRFELITELAKAHGFRGFDYYPLSDEDLASFSEKLRTNLRDADKKLQELKAAGRLEEQELQKELQDFKSAIAGKVAMQENERRQMNANRTKMDQLKRQLDAESRQLGDEDEIKANVATAEAELEEAQNQFRSLDIDNRLKRLGNDLASKEHELKTIQDEMAVANSLAETRARYGLKNTEKQRKEQTLQKLVDESVVEFETVFGRKIPADRLESEVSSALRTKQRDIESAREQVNKANQELSSCETRMTMHKKKLKDLEAELAEATAKFVSVVPGFRSVDQYDEKLKESEHKVNDFRDVIGSWSGMERSYRKFLKYVQEKHRCAVCMRAVPENEAENVVKSIQTQLEQMPVNKEGIQEDLEIAEEELAELHAVLPVRERYVKLQQTLIPDVQRDLADAERAKNEAVASLDGFEKVLGDYEAAEKSGHGLKRKAEEASRLRKELRLLDEETSKLKTELESAGSAGTGEELREQQSVKQTEIDKVRKEMADANRNARTKQAEIQAKTSRYRDAKEKSDAFQVRQEKQKRLKEDIATLQQDNADKETNIRKMEIEIDEQRPKMIDLESRLQELRQQQANREADANKEVGKLAQSQNRLQAYDKEIQRYHDEGVADRLHDVDLKLKKRETDLLGTQADLQSIAEEASRLDKRTSEEAVERRNIEDNLRLRKLKRDLVSTNRELEKLKGERTDLDKGTLNQQFQRLKAKQDKLVEERAHIMGELKQLEERQRQIQNQLSTDFKNVEKQYSEQLISLKTKEMAHVDLEKYAKALDIAIMKYHSMKMDEINKIIKELWQKTYKGNDIQTIEIRADAESAKGNRSYNYRVVMVKETTELDMRGRCSAGQKVLTALIIRLALAETFCINCGVLALDEPTTNLDHENMMSLAQSLADIIEDRKKQANFQLIVITHDEDFMRALGASNHADYFFRIEKDEQGHPHIKRKAIASR